MSKHSDRDDVPVGRHRMVVAVWLVAALILGAVLGVFIGGEYFVAKSAGLAGAAEVLFYGLCGGLFGLIAGRSCSRRLPWLQAWLGAYILGAGALLVFALGVLGFSEQSRELDAELERAYNNVPAHTLQIYDWQTVAHFQYDSRDRTVQAKVEARTCSGQLSGSDRIIVITALRGLEANLALSSATCDDCVTGTRVAWYIEEKTGIDSQGDWTLNLSDQPSSSFAPVFDAMLETLTAIGC